MCFCPNKIFIVWYGYKSIFSKNEEIDIIEPILSKVAGFDIDKKNIKVFGSVVYIRENPILKNEIFFKKKEILEKIEIVLNSKKIKDIK